MPYTLFITNFSKNTTPDTILALFLKIDPAAELVEWKSTYCVIKGFAPASKVKRLTDMECVEGYNIVVEYWPPKSFDVFDLISGC